VTGGAPIRALLIEDNPGDARPAGLRQPMIASVDAERLGRVLRNLLGNAQKFSPEHGTILVEVERSGAFQAPAGTADG
jgi:signal transduction histidine kinase